MQELILNILVKNTHNNLTTEVFLSHVVLRFTARLLEACLLEACLPLVKLCFRASVTLLFVYWRPFPLMFYCVLEPLLLYSPFLAATFGQPCFFFVYLICVFAAFAPTVLI